MKVRVKPAEGRCEGGTPPTKVGGKRSRPAEDGMKSADCFMDPGHYNRILKTQSRETVSADIR